MHTDPYPVLDTANVKREGRVPILEELGRQPWFHKTIGTIQGNF